MSKEQKQWQTSNPWIVEPCHVDPEDKKEFKKLEKEVLENLVFAIQMAQNEYLIMEEGYTTQLRILVVKAYLIAWMLRKDSKAWRSFKKLPFWDDCRQKPHWDRHLKWVLYFIFQATDKYSRDRAGKYARALEYYAKADVPPHEVLTRLKADGGLEKLLVRAREAQPRWPDGVAKRASSAYSEKVSSDEEEADVKDEDYPSSQEEEEDEDHSAPEDKEEDDYGDLAELDVSMGDETSTGGAVDTEVQDALHLLASRLDLKALPLLVGLDEAEQSKVFDMSLEDRAILRVRRRRTKRHGMIVIVGHVQRIIAAR